jgi:hypothetical protein
MRVYPVCRLEYMRSIAPDINAALAGCMHCTAVLSNDTRYAFAMSGIYCSTIVDIFCT